MGHIVAAARLHLVLATEATGVGNGGLGPLTFLFEGPNMTVAHSLLKNAAPSLS